MISVADNFSYQGAKPLDARLKYDTLADMKAVVDATMYEGCEAYCVETDKYYKFKSTNTVDADTGKWREREDSAGHTIEDSEGTDLTQRDTLQFGEGFLAEDDSTNEKTVISPDVMQSGDMDDVVTPLPSVGARYHRYSTEEQVVGEWIDGKPVYERIVTGITLTDKTVVSFGISDIDELVEFTFIKGFRDGNTWYRNTYYYKDTDYLSLLSSTDGTVYCLCPSKTYTNAMFKVRYTKTTD